MAMSDRDTIIKEIDAIVDTYHSAEHPLPVLIELRRNLAVFSYRLAAHVKEVYGKAGLTYATRKFRIAEHIVGARNIDAKAPISFLETSALKIPAVMEAQKAEIEAEAEREGLIARIRAINNVLASLQQEIADLRAEKNNPSYSNEGQ